MLGEMVNRFLPGRDEGVTTRMRFPEKRPFLTVTAFALLLLAVFCQTLSAQTAPTLGTSQSFAVLGASAVTNTGPSVITGDLGVYPGTSITGIPSPGVLIGGEHQTDAVAMQAQADALTAYNVLAGEARTATLTGQDLGGLTLTAGVYFFSSSAQLTGTLTLDAQNNPNAVFIFQIGTTLTTASNSSVMMINGGVPCNVFFQVGSSATLGTGTQFLGSIFANQSVTLNTNATVVPGRVVALNGAVTLDSNVITVSACASGFLQVCKVAGSGVAPGTNFTFTIPSAIPPQSTGVTVAAGAAPLGTCSAAILVPTGAVAVTETIPGGDVLAGVFTLPSGALVSSNLATGAATVTVNAGTTTTVTFIDAAPPTTGNGYVQVCKVAGAGVAVGTNFTFNVAGTPETIPAGAAPGGTCGTPVQVAAVSSPVTVAEVPGGTTVTSISTLPSAGLLVSSNLAGGSATVTVTAGGQTIVTFIDSATPTAGNGYVQVCKVAGAGVTVGTNFNFTIAGANPQTIAAGAAPGGTCGTPVQVAAASSPVTVAETVPGPGGAVPTSIFTLPSAALTASNLAAGTASVTVTAGATTVVTFTDAVPIALTTGFLEVCKVAQDVGIAGSNFTFSVAGTPVTLAAGAPPLGSCSAALAETAGPVLITETVPAGVLLTSVATLPAAGLLVTSNLGAGTATVTVPAGGLTVATFTDAFPAPLYLVGFASNLSNGESYIDIINSGSNGASLLGPGLGPAVGNICANIYAYAPDEQLISCCSCLVTPDGVINLGVNANITSNTATGVTPTSVMLGLVATLAGAGGSGTGNVCNNSAAIVSPATVVPGMVAWSTTVQPGPTTGTYATTEAAFAAATLSASDLTSAADRCAAIIGNNGGSGICTGCQTGALGASKK